MGVAACRDSENDDDKNSEQGMQVLAVFFFRSLTVRVRSLTFVQLPDDPPQRKIQIDDLRMCCLTKKCVLLLLGSYLTILLNGFIHSVMYTYYFVSMHTDKIWCDRLAGAPCLPARFGATAW